MKTTCCRAARRERLHGPHTTLGPGGAIYNVSPDGKEWELFSVGFRNEYDAAYHKNGDLFTYDADMEWDFNTPWYRPTRVCLVTSGSEFGWRNGAGKYPPFYPDTLPPVQNVGPGSPTGVCFGYGAKFPQKYQDALFMCDWSYGKLYAAHLRPEGSAYTVEREEFLNGTPLPLTDVVINPVDGAMYFIIGGRKTKSGLYRVTYVGEPVKPTDRPPDRPPFAVTNAGVSEAARGRRGSSWKRSTRRSANPPSMPRGRNSITATGSCSSRPASRSNTRIRSCGRIERSRRRNRRRLSWRCSRLTRVSAPCPQHAKADSPKSAPELRGKVLGKLNEIDLGKLTTEQKLDLARVYQVALNRLGPATADERKAILTKLCPAFPSGDSCLDGMVLEILVYLQDDTAAPKAIKLLNDAPTQEEQIEYALAADAQDRLDARGSARTTSHGS